MHYLLAVITKEKDISRGVEIPKRTFDNWRYVIWDMFGISIVNENRGEYRYYIDNVEDISKNGEAISTHNPNSKWDSWRVLDINTSFLGIQQLSQLKDMPHPLETDSEIETGQKFPDMNHHYREQLKWDKDFRSGWYETHYPTLFDYICYRLPYDIVFPDGSWHSYDRGGIDVNRVYCKTFYDFLDILPQDYWLTLVDCHI